MVVYFLIDPAFLNRGLKRDFYFHNINNTEAPFFRVQSLKINTHY